MIYATEVFSNEIQISRRHQYTVYVTSLYKNQTTRQATKRVPKATFRSILRRRNYQVSVHINCRLQESDTAPSARRPLNLARHKKQYKGLNLFQWRETSRPSTVTYNNLTLIFS